MMRMTQPSSSDSAAHLIPDGTTGDGGYQSMTNFGAKSQGGTGSLLNRKSSKGTFGAVSTGKRVPSIGRTSGAGVRPLP